jgi:hypothetical protein
MLLSAACCLPCKDRFLFVLGVFFLRTAMLYWC